MPEYELLFDDDVYADLVQYQYDSSRWMRMDHVLAKATEIPRSKKMLDELCRKGVMQIGDTLTTEKRGDNGVTLSFSATIEALDHDSFPLMRTTGQTGNNMWTCSGPLKFFEAMAKVHPSLEMGFRNTWDPIFVTRNDQTLGSLHELRQCYQLWVQEIEKWECNGLGERLGDGRAPRRDWKFTVT